MKNVKSTDRDKYEKSNLTKRRKRQQKNSKSTPYVDKNERRVILVLIKNHNCEG